MESNPSVIRAYLEFHIQGDVIAPDGQGFTLGTREIYWAVTALREYSLMWDEAEVPAAFFSVYRRGRSGRNRPRLAHGFYRTHTLIA